MKYLFSLLIISLIGISCTDIGYDLSEESVRHMTYTLTPDNGNPIVLEYVDTAGNRNYMTSTTGALRANTTYRGTITVETESDPMLETTIEEQAENYQVFYFYDNTLEVSSFSYSDKDSDDKPIGLTTTLTTGDASKGKLHVQIRKDLRKEAKNVEDGNPNRSGGEEMVNAQFEVEIQ